MTTPDFRLVERYDRNKAYNASDKGQARKAKYRKRAGRPMTHARYLSREFIAWDGEGVTLPDGRHIYTLLANSKGAHIVNPEGLSTTEILAFVWQQCQGWPDAFHVIYGGGYDFNMWLSDLSEDDLRRVYSKEYAPLGPYRVQWRRGKSFWFKPIAAGRGVKGAMIYDVVSFFQCSFVKACDSYLGDDFTDRDMIVANKALRSSFTLDDSDEVLRYNAAELVNLVRLMTELRLRLDKAGLRPSRWDGPGAIASALLSKRKIKQYMKPSPDAVAEAARYAYAGGRFEVCKYGISTESVYEYDINSAYPAALCHVPDLQRGTWQYDPAPDPERVHGEDFTLYHVHFSGGDYRYPQPLFFRTPVGAVLYPGDESFYGWYWGPDVFGALEYMRLYGDREGARLEVRSAWRFVPNDASPDWPVVKPFEWIPDMYTKRQILKAAGDGAHVGYKLALNSLYGKTAQQVGARVDPVTGELRIPPFHQLEWAGFVTAWCRSQVYRAALQDITSVVAFETDALFTTAPLSLPEGTGLGEWEVTKFDSLTYIQSGTYFGTSEGEQVTRTRGVNLGSLTRPMVEEALTRGDAYVTAPLTTFITAGLGLRGRWGEWRRWITGDKNITLQPSGKRFALPSGEPGWQLTHAARVHDEEHSSEFPIAWINPDPDMMFLEEAREMNAEEMGSLE